MGTKEKQPYKFLASSRRMRAEGIYLKAQVTLFIIIGLVLLLSSAVFFYYLTVSKEEQENVPVPREITQASFTAYVESCLDATAAIVIEKSAHQGGMYDSVYYKSRGGTKINYWCYREEDQQCVNALFLKKDLEEQIVYGIRQELNQCLDFASFEEQGYTINEGRIEGKAIIVADTVDLTLTYPIKLKKETQEITVETFHTVIPTPLGELYTVAQHILNEEAIAGFFDVLAWQLNHTPVRIQKEKPYPSTIYAIQKANNDLILFFAIQGLDTAENPGEVLLAAPQQKYGCCYVTGSCYANTPKTSCTEKQGTYETAPCSCDEPRELQATETSLCTGSTCDNCGIKKHGESWCEYDASAGEGRDTVGSRHSLYSCFDSEITIEPCRDYREEICVETKQEGKSKALCRANRWQDCAACTTEKCCENTAARDCYWNEDLAPIDGTQCVPYVPPGLKFWDFNGLEICSRGNQKEYCVGLHCSQAWVDAAAIACSSQGDCGNSKNSEGVLTKQGIFISDPLYKPSEDLYDIGKKAEPITALPLFSSGQQQTLETPTEETLDIFIEMLTAAYRFLNQWADMTVPNYFNPFTPKPKIEILDVSICALWQAPNTDAHCQLCEQDEKPCTEYRCKSLGKKCVYEEQDGYPSCTAVPEEKQKHFTIEIDQTTLQSNLLLTEKTLGIENVSYNGYKLTPALTPYTPLTLGIKTTTETICRLDYTPQAAYLDPPLFIAGTPAYAIAHNLTLRVPAQVTIPAKLKATLNVSTAAAVVEALTAPRTLLENFQDKFTAVFQLYKLSTGDDLAEELEVYVDNLIEFMDQTEDVYPYYKNLSITLLDKFDQGGYYLFVSCEDRYGTSQEEELFIEIDISNETMDQTPPVILAFQPENNAMISANSATTSIFLYTDEPAVCRYAYEKKQYEEMGYSFVCKNNPYDFTSIAGGSYECRTTIPTIEEETIIYVACADNPGSRESVLITLQASTTAGVASELYSESIPETIEDPLKEYAEYIRVEEDNETNTTHIAVSSYLLSDTYPTIFNVTTQNVSITLYRDAEMSCVIQNEMATGQMACSETYLEEQHKGMYLCLANLSVPLPIEINESSTESEASLFLVQEAYEITCAKQQESNVNEVPTRYTLKKSTGIKILAMGPKNNEETEKDTALTATTSESEDVRCGYAKYGSLEFVRMEKISKSVFTTALSNLKEGYNSYTLHCKDGYGNAAEATTTFYVKG